MISDRNRTWSRSRDGKASMSSWTKSQNGRRLHWLILGTSTFSILRFYIVDDDDDDFFSLIVLSFRRRRRRERDDQISKLSLPFSSIYEQRAHIKANTLNKVFVYSLFIGFSKNLMMILMMMKMIGVNRPKQRGAGGAAGERRKRNFLLFSFFFHLFWKRRFVWSSTDRHRVQRKRGGVFLSQSFSLFLSFSLSLFLSRCARESQHALTALILFS